LSRKSCPDTTARERTQEEETTASSRSSHHLRVIVWESRIKSRSAVITGASRSEGRGDSMGVREGGESGEDDSLLLVPRWWRAKPSLMIIE